MMNVLLKTRPRERGIILGVTLIILVCMMILGTVAIRSSSTQAKISGNTQDHNQAFQSAETALAVAEKWVSEGHPPFVPLDENQFTQDGQSANYKGLYNTDVSIDQALGSGHYFQLGNTSDGGFSDGSSVTLPNVAKQPVYIIELVKKSCFSTPPQALLKTTARGWGSNQNSVVTLVSQIAIKVDCGQSGLGGGFSVTIGINPN